MSETDRRSLRERFLAERDFELDRFQSEALDYLDDGMSVLVAAPTGSGKTLVAEYAIAQALERGERAFYTTPLKALSNQKFLDLARDYGMDRVGLLTGDVTRNPDAPIVVMTTEVLRNMIYAGPERLEAVHCVVLDEVHYLEDRYRGSVWEEIILSAPPEIVLVCLSATVSNATELVDWITTVRGATGAVIETTRPIELRHLYVVGDRSAEEVRILPTFVDGVPNPEAIALDARAHRTRSANSRYPPVRMREREKGSLFRPRRFEVIERMAAEELLPAIYFVFSRAGCDDAVRQCLDAGVRLTTGEERRIIRGVVDEHVDKLADADLRVLGYERFRSSLESGIAAHHAGMVPPFREAVEELFGKALVRVVFSTETLALGINMPARSVVIESLSKFSGSGHQDLTAGEYTQLTGRAGRRGIDAVGYGAVLFSPFHTFNEVAALASASSRAIRSSFHPTYNMVVNLVRRYRKEEAYALVSSSFAQYLSKTPLTAQLDAVVELLSDRRYIASWRLTPLGAQLSRVYHDCDLLITEAIEDGLFDGLDAPSLAAFASLFTFEARRTGPGSGVPPSARLERRAARLEELSDELRASERRLGLPRTRRPHGGFAQLAYEWASGAELTRLISPPRSRQRGSEQLISGGDFVRNMKQLVDLLRQIGTAASNDRLGATARRAAESLVRGLVAASSAPPHLPDDESIEVTGDPPGIESRPVISDRHVLRP